MICNCQFTPYQPGDEDHGTPSWHYRRTCLYCKHIWWGLHCPHDGHQNPCPKCGQRPEYTLAVEVAQKASTLRGSDTHWRALKEICGSWAVGDSDILARIK